MKKIKTGDQVIVISGKDKGKQGMVTLILTNGKCLVSGVKIAKHHIKSNPQAGIEGGIVQKEAPLNLSNLAIYNSSTKKRDKVGIKTLEDGKRVRIYKSTLKEIKK